MIGLEFDHPIADLRKKLLYDQNIFTGSSSNKNTLRLLPPLNIGEKEVTQFLKALKKVME
jgi:acetylornithine aminotransferase